MSNREPLSGQTLTMFVGPSAVGKSTIMEAVTREDPNFVYVRSFTTRDPRPGEISHYRHITRDEAEAIRQSGEYYTFNEHPTTHNIYGTDTLSFPGPNNLLDTLSGNVAEYRALPFDSTATIAVAAHPADWQKWFTSRFPEPSIEAQKRLDEAKLSINWALNDPEVHWLVNRDRALQEIARKAVAIVMRPPTEREIPDEPYKMLEQINDGMWQ